MSGGDRRDLRCSTTDLGRAGQKPRAHDHPFARVRARRRPPHRVAACSRSRGDAACWQRQSPDSRRDSRPRHPRPWWRTSRRCEDRRARAMPAGPARARGPRGCCARGTRRGRRSGSRRGAGPAAVWRSGSLRSPAAPVCPDRTAARSGRASRLHGRASSRVRRQYAARSTAPPRGEAAARSPDRPRQAPAGRAWSCPPRVRPSTPGPFAPGSAQGCPERAHRSEAGSLLVYEVCRTV